MRQFGGRSESTCTYRMAELRHTVKLQSFRVGVGVGVFMLRNFAKCNCPSVQDGKGRRTCDMLHLLVLHFPSGSVVGNTVVIR